MKPITLSICAALLILSSCAPKDSVDRRVEELLDRMTLDEKIGQMNLVTDYSSQVIDGIRSGSIGSVINCVDPVKNNELQHIAVEQTRLGIPLLIGRDVIHGFNTIFPIPLGLAATFDTALTEVGARCAAQEASSVGVRWTFSPMLDIARDPRWGRIAEGSGEDTYLTTQMGVAMVRGYQGDNPADPSSMAACIKHFVGYGAAEGGRDYNSTSIPERVLRNVYLPPFEACVKAGALSLMTSFNDNDGVPSTGNTFILRDVLTDQWGFDGMIVTDWNSAGEMISHGFATDEADVAEKSIAAGVDMDMMSFAFVGKAKELIKQGRLTERQIDDCVRDILRLKFRLGLFENPFVDETLSAEVVGNPEILAAAKQSALESAILLKNDNRTLPLKDVRSILVTGPMADAAHDQLGTWTFDGRASETVTLLAALRAEQGLRVVYEPVLGYSRDKSTDNFGRLRRAARGVDAIVVCVGEEAILSGEAHCLSDLNLMGAQSDLIAEAHKTGKPVVTVVIAGRPLTIERDLANCDAMLYSFHPGTMGGAAIADLLLGRAVPSGKSPVTFLRTVGQAPFYYNHNMTGRPNTGTETLLHDIPAAAGQTSLGCTSYYLDSGYGPLFPFGYGLSYTTFIYSDLATDKVVYGQDDTIRVTCTLANSGDTDATEVTQLYVRDLVGSVTRPVKELKGFKRVDLAAGSKTTVEFELPVSELAFWNYDMEYTVETGDFQLWVAGDSGSGRPLSFKVK